MRYDQPPTPASPIPGTVNFQPGQPGTTLDVDRAMSLIRDALNSISNRVVNLAYSKSSAPRPSLQNLQILLQQIIELSQFEGLVELYLEDLQNNQVIHFTYQSGQTKPIPLNVAFSGWSTIKIPVLISAFRGLGDPASPDAINLMESMIERSDNDSTDRLASTVIDKRLAPVMVTDDMITLGITNTFWGGFFYPGVHPCSGATKPPPTNVQTSTPDRTLTTRPLPSTWVCCWVTFTSVIRWAVER